MLRCYRRQGHGKSTVQTPMLHILVCKKDSCISLLGKRKSAAPLAPMNAEEEDDLVLFKA
jgi:hypothetical protein